MYVCMYMYTHAHTHIYIHVYIHTIYVHIHTIMHVIFDRWQDQKPCSLMHIPKQTNTYFASWSTVTCGRTWLSEPFTPLG